MSKETSHLKRIAKIDNAKQTRLRQAAKAVRADATPDERRHYLKFSSDEVRARMAGCPWMDKDTLRKLYHDYPKLVDFNTKTPSHLMDKYLETDDANRLAIYQSSKRTDEQLYRIAELSGTKLACLIADSGSMLPDAVVEALFGRGNPQITVRLRAALIRCIANGTESDRAVRLLASEMELPEGFIRSTWAASREGTQT